MLAAGPALANPTGGTVAAGAATISAPNPTTLAVTQQTQRAVIDWQSFSIGAGETTEFIQPNSGAFILNRVTGGDPSLIAGHIVANGNVAIVNGAGILFLNGSTVDVNSLVATPADISNSNFMAGRLDFDIAPANPNATVVNDGRITVKDDGLAALVAPGVANSGVIAAKLGTVVLAGAKTFTVDLYGDGLINFAVGQAPATAAIHNTGTIAADGGTVLLTAATVDAIVSNVVTGGTLDARSVGTKTGTVEISGGSVALSGAIDVSGANPGETGGTVEVTGGSVTLAAGAAIDASGAAGGGTVLIGGGFKGQGPLADATSTTIDAGASIVADALDSGNGGNVAVWSNGATVFDGQVAATGATGASGGTVETSGSTLSVAGSVDTAAPEGTAGTWLLDPATNMVIGSTLAATINGANSNVALEASGSITVETALKPQDSLALEAGQSIALDANINFATNASTGNLFLTATAGAITVSGATITMDGGAATLAAATGIGTATAPLATVGLGSVAANTTAGAIFLANGTSGNATVGAPAGFTFTAGTAPTPTNTTDDGGDTITEESGGTGANALVVSTRDLALGQVAFASVSGLLGTGEVSLLNSAGSITIDQSVDSSGGPIALSASNNLDIEASVGATTTGAITLAADSNANGSGLLTVNGAVGSANAGAISLSAATILVSATVEGGSTLTIAPSTAGTSIALGDDATGTFVLDGAELADLGSGASIGAIGTGFTGITIGLAGGTGAIEVDNGSDGTLSFAAPLTLQSAGTGGTITVQSALAGTGAMTLLANDNGQTAIAIDAPIATSGPASLSLTATKGKIVSVAGGTLDAGSGGITLSAERNLTIGDTVGATTTGPITLIADSGASGNGLLTIGGAVGSGAAGNVTLSAATIAVNATVEGDGTLTIAPSTASSAIALGDGASGKFALDAASLGNLGTGAGGAIGAGFSALTIGRVDGTGAIDVNNGGTGTLTVAPALTLESPGATGTVTVETALIADAGLALEAGGAASSTAISLTAAVTATGDVGLSAANGNIAIGAALAGANLYLAASAGTVTESGGGITAGSGAGDLIVATQNATALNRSNSIGVLAADITGGGFGFTNAGGFTVGSASADPPTIGTVSLSGVTAAGDIGLVASSGTLTLDTSVIGHNIYLSAASGAVTQNGGAIEANSGADGLIVVAASDTALDSSTNDIGTLSASVTDGGFGFTNAAGFTVGAATASPPGITPSPVSGVTATSDVGLVATAGTIALTDSVTGADIYLSALSGTVTEGGGAIVANGPAQGLIVVTDTDTALNAAGNSIGLLSANVTGGGFGFTNDGSFTVGTATVSPPGITVTAVEGVTATADVGLVASASSSGSIALANDVTGANVYLGATAGAVTESTGGIVAGSGAGGAIVVADGDTALNAADNWVGLLSANVTGGGFGFTNKAGFTVGTASVSAPGLTAPAVAGVTATAEAGLVASAGTLTLGGAVTAADIYLSAAQGAVTEAGGTVATPSGAGDLLVIAKSASALNDANTVGVLSADVTHGGFGFTDDGSFTVGTASVSPPGLTPPATAGVTASADAGLVASAGSITLAGNVSAANVYLSASGAVTEGAGSIVTPSGLGDLIVAAANDSALNAGGNAIGVLSAQVTSGGFAFTNDGAFTVGTASVSPPGITATAPVGVSATTDVGLVASAGSLTLGETVAAANVYLAATAGAVTESGGAVATTAGLGDLLVAAKSGSALIAAGNSVAVLSADITAGGFAFSNDAGFAVGDAAVSPPGITPPTVAGVTATGAVGLVVPSGSLTLDAIVSGSNVYLSAAAGAVTEAGGAIAANAGAGSLIVAAEDDTALDNANNDIGGLSAKVTSGGFSFTNEAGFAVTAATVTPPGIGSESQGAVTAANDVGLVATAGGITLDDTVAGTNVYLKAAAGAVTESGGAVDANAGAGGLILVAGAGSALDSATNDIATLSAQVTGGLGFVNEAGFTVGAATASPPSLTPPSLSGVTASGDVGLVTPAGTITLADTVSGADIYLGAAADTVVEAGGAIVAGAGSGDLLVVADSATALDELGNRVGVLSARVSAGGFTFANDGGFTAGTASVSAPGLTAPAVAGVSADGDSALIASPGTLTLASAVDVAGFDLLLNAAGGVDESGSGAVTANGLLVRAGGNADLGVTNEVATLAARYGGSFDFKDGTALAVGAVSVSAPSVSDTTNNTGVGDGSGSGDAALVVTNGALTLDDGVDVGAHNLLLASDNSSVGGTGAITANGLAVVMTGNESLSGSYAAIGASIASGGFSYVGSQSFNAGLTIATPSLGGIYGVAASGDVGLVASSGSISIVEPVSGANVYLSAAAGAVNESGSGTVAAASGAGDLLLFASGNSALGAAGNSVGILSADVTDGGLLFDNAGAFAVNTAFLSPPTIGFVFGFDVTATRDVGLAALSGSLTIAEAVTGANVLLSATAGGVNETTGTIDAGNGAGDLIVLSRNDSALDATTNTIGLLAGNVSAGGLAYTNDGALVVGSASVDPAASGTTTHVGLSAADGVGLVAASGNLTLAQTVSGADILLSAPAGAVTETTGAVTADAGAGGLIVEALTGATLGSTSNDIGTLAAEVSAGALAFTNTGGFATGSLDLSIPATVVSGASGVTAALSGIDVATNLALDAKSGSITQSSALTIGGTSDIVAEGTNGSIVLTDGTNDLTGAVTLMSAAGGSASLMNGAAGGTVLAASTLGGGLTIVASSGSLTESGTISSGGTLALKTAAGSIAIDGTLESTAGNIFLEADGAGSTITAAGGSLTLGAAGSVSLVANAGIGSSGATQIIPLVDAGGAMTLAATTATGGIYVGVTDAAGLTLGAQATPPAGFATLASGGVAALGDIAISNTAGGIALARNATSTAGNVYLEADGAGAAITDAGGAIELSGGALALVADAGVGTASAPVRVVDGDALALAGATETGGWYASVSSPDILGATVTVSALATPSFFATGAVEGISATTAGAVALQNAGGSLSGGSIVLTSSIDAAGSVFLEADGPGAAIATAGGAITLGGNLSLVANAGVGQASAPIAVTDGTALTLAGATSTGGWYVGIASPGAAGASVTIGAVTTPSFFAETPVTGITVADAGSVAVRNAGGTASGGSISIADAVTLSGDAGGSVFLEADGAGAAFTSGGGTIKLDGGSLSLVAEAGVGTASAPILVSDGGALTLAGATSTGGWYLSASSPNAAGAALTIGTVTPPAYFAATPVVGVTVASSGDVAIENGGGTATGGSIALADTIDAAGNVFLDAARSGASIAASGGAIELAGGNLSLVSAGTVGAAAAPIPVVDSDALTLAGAGATGWYVSVASPSAAGAAATVGTLDPPAFFASAPVVGITIASSGDLALENAGGTASGGAIVLASAIDAAGRVFLEADGTGAAITASGGTITLAGGALSLVANAGVGTASAPIAVVDGSALTLAGATVTGGWYASVSSPNAAGATVTVGALDAPAFFADTTVTGIAASAAGDIAIRNAGGSATGGALVLAQGIDGAGNVFLEADRSGATIATTGGVIDLAGGGLSLVANAGVGTATAPILVSDADAMTLAGATATGGWYASVSSPAAAGAAVTVGMLAPPEFFASTPLTGIAVTSHGDIGVQNTGGSVTGGMIVLAEDVAGAGNVFLEATGTDAMIAASGGTIELAGGTLSLFATGGIGTSTAGVAVTDADALTLAGETAMGGIFLTAADAAGVTVGRAAATLAFFANGTTDGLNGLASIAGGDVGLRNSAGSLSLASPIDIAAGGSVYLEADGAGARIATPGGAIDLAGGALSLVANAGLGTPTAPIEIADASPLIIAGATETGGWYVSVSSPAPAGAAVTVGTVTPPAFFTTTPVVGVTIGTSGNFALQNAGGTAGSGSIVLASDVNLSTDAGGNAYLQSLGAGGTIAAAGGVIRLDGTELLLAAAGGIGTSTSPIAASDTGALTLAATTAGGGVYLSDGSPGATGNTLTVGTVTAPGFFPAPTITGVSSDGGNVSIANLGGAGAAGGAIDLAAPLALGGGALSLGAAGPIDQTAGTIAAGTLAVAAGNTVSLTNANAITNLGSVTLGAGDFLLQDTGNLSLVGNAAVQGAIDIATTGTITVPGGITYMATANVGLGSAGFTEIGTFMVMGAPATIIDATGLSAVELDAITVRSSNDVNSLPLGPGLISAPMITFGGGFAAPGSTLLISVDGTTVTGDIDVGGLGVTGINDTIDLFGSIAGDSSQFAAALAVRAQGPDNADKFNACAIGSPSCVAQPMLLPVFPSPSLNSFDFLALPAPLDPLDIDRLDTGNEDNL